VFVVIPVTYDRRFFSQYNPVTSKSCQLWIKVQRFGDNLRLHHQGNDIKAEEEMVSETMGFYPQLTRLVARDFMSSVSVKASSLIR
jgi:hypothetical protein